MHIRARLRSSVRRIAVSKEQMCLLIMLLGKGNNWRIGINRTDLQRIGNAYTEAGADWRQSVDGCFRVENNVQNVQIDVDVRCQRRRYEN